MFAHLVYIISNRHVTFKTCIKGKFDSSRIVHVVRFSITQLCNRRHGRILAERIVMYPRRKCIVHAKDFLRGERGGNTRSLCLHNSPYS